MSDSLQREQAVQAITAKNRLHKLISKAERHRDGSQEAEQALLALRQQYTEAGEQIERVKAMMRTEEERVRHKTAEVLRQKQEWNRQQLFGPFPGSPNNDTSHFLTALVSALLFMVSITCLLLCLR